MYIIRLLSLIGITLVQAGCLTFGDRVLERRLPPEEDEEVLLVSDVDAAAVRSDARALAADPHAVLGVQPGHGPFTGGQLALIRGNGFGSDVVVWFGDARAEPLSVVPIDANRVQVQVPPGSPGPVDVTTQNGDDASTRRVLKQGYDYDAFFVTPGSGPTGGGNIVTLTGEGVEWSSTTRVLIDLAECELIVVRQNPGQPSELDCRAPPGSAGQKPVTVEASESVRQTLVDGYTYTDSADGFEGGLSGNALKDTLDVLVLNGYSGERVAGATVFVHSSGDSRATTDRRGHARVTGLDSPGKVTLTAAMPCMQPVTLVDVPVDRATIYLDPVLTPACIPPIDEIPNVPGGGGGVARMNTIHGELAFGLGVEYKRGSWRNVPLERSANESQVAYVFELSSSSRQPFQLPSRADAVTPSASGSIGYSFRYDTRSSGNLTLYALAGIERNNTSPRQFTPYALGLLRGVSTSGAGNRPFIPMKLTLDHAVTLDVSGPSPTPRGPDRVEIDLALKVGQSGFVPLPRARTSVLLPLTDPLKFVGVPQLVGSLHGAQYVSTVKAVSGPSAGFPWSQLEAVATKSSDVVVPLKDFVEVPVLLEPGLNQSWEGRKLEVTWAAGGSRVDLLVFDIESAGGGVRWRVIAPGTSRVIELPELSAEPGLGLRPGRINVSVSAARIRDFDYATLRERDFSRRGWTAYATDSTPSILR